MLSTIERHQQIVQKAQRTGKVFVDQLAGQFEISTVTIRSDLNELDAKGLLIRCRGGAIASTRLTKELSVRERYKKHSSVKQRLGRAAAELVRPGDSVILDSGTTTEEVAHCLNRHRHLMVTTNGLNIATVLADVEGVEVSVTGGVLRKKSMSFYGRTAEESLRHKHFNKVILGVDGFDLKAGLTTYFEPEASLNRLMCDLSTETIAVTDSSKFDRRVFHVICPWKEITTLVTDSNIPSSYADELSAVGIELCIVDV